MSENTPSDQLLRSLNKRGGELADELLALLRPHTGDYGAVLSAFQLLLSRSPCGAETDLALLEEFIQHNFGPGFRIMLAVPAKVGGDGPPAETKH